MCNDFISGSINSGGPMYVSFNGPCGDLLMKIKMKGPRPKNITRIPKITELIKAQTDKTLPVKMGADCEACPLKDSRIGPINRDPKTSKILVCGDFPKLVDVNVGRLFNGHRDRILSFMLEAQGLSREDIGLTNSILCVPPEELDIDSIRVAMKCCAPRLDAEAESYSDIVALGELPFEALTGITDKESKDTHGQYYGKVLSTYSMSYAESTNPNIITMMVKDMYRLGLGNNAMTIKEHFIADCEGLRNLVADIQSKPDARVVIDIETSHTDRIHSWPHIWWEQTILCLGICYESGISYVLPEQLIMTKEALEILKPVLLRKTLAGANFKFDVLILQEIYYKFFGEKIDIGIDEDTFLMSYVLDEISGRHSLKEHASWFNDRGYDDAVKKYITKKRDSYAQVPDNILRHYLAKDVCYTYNLIDVFKERLQKNNQYEMPYKSILIEAQNTFVQMEYLGVYTNAYKIKEAYKKVSPLRDKLLSQIKSIVGNDDFNPNSPKQLGEFLYDVCGLPLPKSAKGKRSTNVKAIDDLMNSLAEVPIEESKAKQLLTILSDYRTKQKLLSTYITKLPDFMDERDWSHHSFNLGRTVTGRLAGGILMTLPADSFGGPLIRGCFKAPDKITHLKEAFQKVVQSYIESKDSIEPLKQIKILKDNPNKGPNEPSTITVIEAPGDFVMLDADYSQAEVRGAGFLSQDTAIIDAYLNNKDIHDTIARIVFGIAEDNKVPKDKRRIAKGIVFGYLYGMHYTTLIGKSFVDEDGVIHYLDNEGAQHIFNSFEDYVQQFKVWRDIQFTTLESTGAIYTPTRRMRRVFLVIDRLKHYVQNQAYNFPVQSFANDIALMALVRINKFFRKENLPVWPNIFLHDGIYLICYNDKDLISFATKNVSRIMQETARDMQKLEWGMYKDMTCVPFKADVDLRVYWA